MLLRKKIYQIGLTAIIFALGVFSFAGTASAEKTNEIKVEICNNDWSVCELLGNGALFENVDFLPGDITERKVRITNEDVTGSGGGSSQEIAIEAINVNNPYLSWPFVSDKFGDILNFKVEENGGSVKYEKTLSKFFDNSGETVIDTLENGDSKKFIFSVYFDKIGDNKYQDKSIGFDIIFGLKGEGGGDEGCNYDGAQNNEEAGVDCGGGGCPVCGGGGGGGGLPPGLIILDQSVKATNIGEYSVTILWTTSYFSTSQVVYASETEYNNGYTFDLAEPNYGYFSATLEKDNTPPINEAGHGVTGHSVFIDGLSPNTTYYYRAVSHASPPSISRSYSFTTTQKKNLSETEEVLFETPPEGEGEIAYQQEAEEAEELSQSKELPFSQIDLPPAEPPVNSGISGAEEEMENNITDEQQEEEVPKKSMLMAGIGSLLSHGTGNIWMDFTLGIIIILIIAGIVYYFIARERRKKKENPE